MSHSAAFVLFGVCLIVAFLFFVRLLCSMFSRAVAAQMTRRPRLHFAWGIFSVLVAMLAVGGINPFALIANLSELRDLRAQVAQRAKNAGGWEAVRRGCAAFASTNEAIRWTRWQRDQFGSLPPALAALKPQTVDYLPASPSRGGGPPVVSIKIFGMHATGGHSTPYIGLEVSPQSSGEDYAPAPVRAASGNGHYEYRKVSEGVYEIY